MNGPANNIVTDRRFHGLQSPPRPVPGVPGPPSVSPVDTPATVPVFLPDQPRQMADELGWEVFEVLARDFLNDLPGDLQRLPGHLAAGTLQDLQRGAHNLKATSLTFGLSQLAEALGHLELAAETGDAGLSWPWIVALSKRSAEGEAALREWLQLGQTPLSPRTPPQPGTAFLSTI